MGNLHVDLPNDSKRTKAIFKNAVHSPEMAFTLLSISKLDKSGHKIVFHKQMCMITDVNGHTIAKIPHSDGLYQVIGKNQGTTTEIATTAAEKMSMNVTHRKLGHISSAAIRHAVSKNLIMGIDLDLTLQLDFCEPCQKAKAAMQPYPKESNMWENNYVYWDLWGPASVRSLNGNQYLVARIDDASRETRLYFLKKKSETFEAYKKHEAYVETQTGNRIKVVHSDRGGEFLSKQFIAHQDSRGTTRELTVHDSPPKNGTAERGMRMRTERACTLLLASGLPHFLWEEAMQHTTWLQNRTPTRALDGKTPYEMRHKEKPYLGRIQEFGVICKRPKSRKVGCTSTDWTICGLRFRIKRV